MIVFRISNDIVSYNDIKVLLVNKLNRGSASERDNTPISSATYMQVSIPIGISYRPHKSYSRYSLMGLCNLYESIHQYLICKITPSTTTTR